jgi:uncharacterized membrane protein YfcA
MSDGALILLGGSVFAGAATQRITGLGFALVSSPFLVLLAGPIQGVLLANVLSLSVNLVVLAMTWRDVEVRRVVLLAVPALMLIPVGAWVSHQLSRPLLLVVIGSLVIVALAAVLLSDRARIFHGTSGAVAAGALSGFMNVTAGVGGPAMTLYALSSGWAQTAFVASMQLYFAIINAGSIVAKGLPSLSLAQVVTAVGALAVGVACGELLTRYVNTDVGRSAVTALALIGASATVIKGVTT